MNQLQVYILECSDGSYYTGVTNDVERRIFEHNNSYDRESYTYTRRPIKCKWVSEPMGPDQAIELEKQIKRLEQEKERSNHQSSMGFASRVFKEPNEKHQMMRFISSLSRCHAEPVEAFAKARADPSTGSG